MGIPSNVTATFEMVDPAKAKRWLATNDDNYRRLDPKIVTVYKVIMANGEWHMNGAPLVFDPKGRLVDGQHRLAAIVAADVALPMLVVRGASDMGMDRGRPRNFTQDLAHVGHRHTATLAAALRIVALYNEGQISAMTHGGINTTRFPWMTDDYLMGLCEKCADLPKSVMWASVEMSQRTGIPRSVLASTHYLLGEEFATERDQFYAGVVSGAGLETGSPILALRRAVQIDREHATKRHVQVSSRRMLALVSKAWNAWLMGERMQLLKFLDTEAMPLLIRSQADDVPPTLIESAKKKAARV